MESQKKQKSGRKSAAVIWTLWSLTIVVTLLLIGFREERTGIKDNNLPVFSDQIAKNEHIPENIGTEFTPLPVVTDKIQESLKTETEQEEPQEEHGKPDNMVTDAQENVNEATMDVPDEEKIEIPEDSPDTTPTAAPDEMTVQKRVIDPDKPMVALTFDDGPYRNNTASLLDLFEQYDARATFFVVGYHLDVFYEDTIDAYRRGFQIGNHTAAHPSLQRVDDEKALQEIRNLNEQLNQLGIPGNVMLRPPYGEYTDYLQENVTVPMIGWNVDSRDWISRDADKIYEEIVGKVKDGDIVLLHDIHDETITAMQRVVPELVAQGFQLVTVEEMFEAKGIEPEAGRYYCYIR